MDSSAYRRIHQATRLLGSARIHAFQHLDALITTTDTRLGLPWESDGFTLLSARVRGFVAQPDPYPATLDLAAISLK